ncbi:MAG: TraR/DksA C4-type zinc finger protein [Thermodesulfobacteriota bacterium]|nr:TraR/DksA C4-type zinc finger protein [Thermodesulfobacteriota bacterium]
MRTDIDLNKFRQRLEKRFEELSAWQDGRKDQSGPVELDQPRMGRLTRMDAMQQQAMSRASDRLIALERQRIQTALNRMESGDYGYCTVCEEEIAEGRLQSDPSLLTCIDCARNAEQG